MLTQEQRIAREGKLTASRVACLMTGDTHEILRLWQEMVGDPSFEEEDLSGVWPVQLGSVTEDLNLNWYQRKRGPVTRRREVVVGTPTWMACTLDGWDVARGCPIETKHTGGREPSEVVLNRYYPQMTWQMMVTGAVECAFSVIAGAAEPVVDYIPRDAAYAADLFERAQRFMACVDALIPPVASAPAIVPVIPERIVVMDSADWKAAAASWIQCYGAAETAKESEKKLKALVPADALRATGAGVTITRNRAGAMSLRKDGANL